MSQQTQSGIKAFFPFLDWLLHYDKANLSGDVIAGVTVAIMLIPQGMAYASLAGLPPIIGLYSSIVPLIVYALMGTSRQLAVGPVAMVSLLVQSGVSEAIRAKLGPQLAGLDSVAASALFGDYLANNISEVVLFAVILSVMVGAIQLAMGLFRMGFVVNFLSHPVISGFTSAAALIIGFSQLKHLFGLNIPRSKNIFKIIYGVFENFSTINWVTLGIGATSVIILVILKKKMPKFPRFLLVVVGGTLAVYFLKLHDASQVKIVADVPQGFPPLSIPSFSGISTEVWKTLGRTALVIGLVGFMESISVAQHFARKNRYEISANQELIGLGAANLAGALFSAYPVTGGFSRTAVNAQAGARTGLATMITAVIIGLTVLFFTPLFYFLPKAVLGAIIFAAVFGLIDVQEAKHLWHTSKSDFWMLVITFLATLFMGIEEGIGIGVLASLGWVIWQTTKPSFVEIGVLSDGRHFRNIDRYPNAKSYPNVLVLRFDGRLYFGNINHWKTQLKALEERREDPIKTVIIEAGGINDLDASALATLEETIEGFERRNIHFVFTGVKGQVVEVLRRAHLFERIGETNIQPTLTDALDMLDLGKPENGPHLNATNITNGAQVVAS